jgi:hypothetical protein
MLPVSGAEQLNASEANTTRPISSLRNAYSCDASAFCVTISPEYSPRLAAWDHWQQRIQG